MTGKKLDVTGQIGEILVASRFGLRLAQDPRVKGYDALDSRGRRVEIKARRSESRSRPSDRALTSRFSPHEFDYVLLAILSHDYKILEVIKADYQSLKPMILRKRRRGKPTGLPIGQVRKKGRVVHESPQE